MDRKSAGGNQDRAGPPRRGRGFTQAGALVGKRIRSVSEKRGIVETRLLTRWEEIAGSELARIARPVKVSYSQGGFGATLTVLTDVARAPEVQMQLPALRERVNACYGYNAISRVRVSQTSASGFAEGAQAFDHDEKPPPAALNADETARLHETVDGVTDAGLRGALELLGRNILLRAKRNSEGKAEPHG